MKTFALYFSLCLLFSLSVSCQNGAEYNQSEEFQTEAPYEGAPKDVQQTEPEEGGELEEVTDDRKIIKTADLKMQVASIREGTEKIKKTVKKYKGFVGAMEMSRSNYEARNSFTVRLDQKNFDDFLSEAEKQGVFVNHLNVNSQDVTEEFVDIEIRLKTKKEVRDRYIDILRNKTGKIEDVLAAEEKIRVITEEIEAKEGRLRFLQNRVNLSTVRLEIYEKLEYEAAPEALEDPFVRRLSESFSNGWQFILSVMVFFVSIWPLCVFGGLAFVFRKKIGAFFRRNKNK